MSRIANSAALSDLIMLIHALITPPMFRGFGLSLLRRVSLSDIGGMVRLCYIFLVLNTCDAFAQTVITRTYTLQPGANLRHADLSHEDLSGVDLTGADLSFANLDSANLTNANLTNAIFNSETVIWTANLTGAELAGVNCSQTCLPDGAFIRSCPASDYYWDDGGLDGGCHCESLAENGWDLDGGLIQDFYDTVGGDPGSHVNWFWILCLP